MLDITPIFEFSRHNCVAICAFLVPANLLATIQTLIFVALHRPQLQIRASVALATGFALILALHVETWFMIGVVREVTFILLGLAMTCLVVNFWTVNYSQTYERFLVKIAAIWSDFNQGRNFNFLSK